MKRASSNTFNPALTGLLILGAIALSGLVLLMVTEAEGSRNWLFNAFMLVAVGTVALYYKVIYRSQQWLRHRVEGT